MPGAHERAQALIGKHRPIVFYSGQDPVPAKHQVHLNKPGILRVLSNICQYFLDNAINSQFKIGL